MDSLLHLHRCQNNDMNTHTFSSKRVGMVLRGLALVNLAATIWAQSSTPPAYTGTSQTAQTTPADTNTGWKRVGDHSTANDPNTYQAQNTPINQNAPLSNDQNYPPVNSNPNGNIQPPSQGERSYPVQSVPARLTVPVGTYLTVRVNQMLSSDKNQAGDAFTASLVQPLVVDGVVVAEPGQTVGGRVATAEKHGIDKTARLGIQLTDLSLVDGQQIPISSQFISRTGRTTSGGTAVGAVAATTGTGAAIGAIAGWGTGAAIGAGAGAAVGLIGVLVTHNHASVIYPEQILIFRIEAPVTISTERSSQAFRYVQPNEYDRPVYTNQQNGAYYESAVPPAPVYNTYGYGYGYPGWGYGWGYPYWGIGFGYYGGYWGGYPYRYYRGGPYYGGRGYYYGGRPGYGSVRPSLGGVGTVGRGAALGRAGGGGSRH